MNHNLLYFSPLAVSEFISKSNLHKENTFLSFIAKYTHFDNEIAYLFCHPEQSEESDAIRQILRFAQNDKLQPINVLIKLNHKKQVLMYVWRAN